MLELLHRWLGTGLDWFAFCWIITLSGVGLASLIWRIIERFRGTTEEEE